MKTPNEIKIEISRKDGKSYLTFEIPPIIEDIYKKLHAEIKTSEKWVGLKFYYLPELLKNNTYKNILHDYGLFDDYGSEIMNDDNYFNIALLRTVGGKGKIKLNNTLPLATLSHQIKNTLLFIKHFHEEFFNDFEIKGKLEIII